MLIYTCLANGQILKNEVLEGIIRNDCDLMAITSSNGEKTHSERNKSDNILEILKHFDDDYFIFMDSDVVMCDKNTIAKISQALKYNAVVTIPTKACHTKHNFPEIMPHAIIGIQKRMIETLKYFLHQEGCAYCEFCKVNLPSVMWNTQAYEITR